MELLACMMDKRVEGGRDGGWGPRDKNTTYRIMTRQQEGQDLITHIVGRQLLARLRVRGGKHESEHVFLVCANALLQLCVSLCHDFMDKLNVGLVERGPFLQKFTFGQHL